MNKTNGSSVVIWSIGSTLAALPRSHLIGKSRRLSASISGAAGRTLPVSMSSRQSSTERILRALGAQPVNRSENPQCLASMLHCGISSSDYLSKKAFAAGSRPQILSISISPAVRRLKPALRLRSPRQASRKQNAHFRSCRSRQSSRGATKQ